MRIIKLTVVALAFLSPVPVLTAAHAAAIPTAGLSSIATHDDNTDWMTTLVQESEGIPNPDSYGHCRLMSRPVTDVHGRFIGHQTFSVCK